MKDFFSIIISSKIDFIRVVRSTLRCFLKLKNVQEAEVFDTELAINEAIANVIEHTYKLDENQKIILSLVWDDENGSCSFFLRDFGPEVEIRKIESRKLEQLEDHGLGVYLIKNIMDEFEFRKTSSSGNVLFMKKKFTTGN